MTDPTAPAPAAPAPAAPAPAAPAAARPAPPAWLSLAIDFGPVIVFFAAFRMFDIITATAAVTVAAVIAAAVSRLVLGQVSVALIITTGVAVVFGGLTVALNDERFVKIKPTIIGLLFAALLLGGLAFGRSLLKPVLAPRFPPMADVAWLKLSRNFGLFFLAGALVNELIWRTFDTATWVAYSTWGDMLLTFGFTMSQVPIINRYMDHSASSAEAAELAPPKG